MGFQTAITIQAAIARIQSHAYLLPAFQREFVWDAVRVENLFDSLMKGYPISSMLFWKVKGEVKSKFRFYSFLDRYVEKHHVHNELFSTSNINDFHAILDGQQRLTALYLGLCGSFAEKAYYRRTDWNEQNYPTCHLYLNISSFYEENENANGNHYKFRFLEKAITREQNIYIDKSGEKWFRVGYIMELGNVRSGYDLDDFEKDYEITREQKKILRLLENVIWKEPFINFYEEETEEPNKAVNIFVRINSGGKPLSYYDILMSMMIAGWEKKDARTEILGLIDTINRKNFDVRLENIHKAFIYLYHKDVRAIVNNFNNEFICKIEDNWEDISEAIISLFDYLKKLGLNRFSLTSFNATLPLLYYIYHKRIWKDFATKICYKEERGIMRQWLFKSLLLRLFGGSSDSALQKCRRVFGLNTDNNVFIDESISLFPSTQLDIALQSKEITDEFILNKILDLQKDSGLSFAILAMLYPTLDYSNTVYHQDHLHPAASYELLKIEDKEIYGWQTYNSILNLQMLDANENMSKQDKSLKDWVDQETTQDTKDAFLLAHIIPDVSLDINDFADFIEKRKAILMKRIRLLFS